MYQFTFKPLHFCFRMWLRFSDLIKNFLRLMVRSSPLIAFTRSFAWRSFDRSKNARKRKRLLTVYRNGKYLISNFSFHIGGLIEPPEPLLDPSQLAFIWVFGFEWNLLQFCSFQRIFLHGFFAPSVGGIFLTYAQAFVYQGKHCHKYFIPYYGK